MNFPSDSQEQTSEPQNAIQEPKKEAKREPEKRDPSPYFQAFEEKLAQLATPEEMIEYGLQCMRESLDNEGRARFREFWDIRKRILECFAKKPARRSELWAKYVELTSEAHDMKKAQEKMSAEVAEHIEHAIQALIEDVANFDTNLDKVGKMQFPEEAPSVQERVEGYGKVLRELYLLNSLSTRMTGLQKEVAKTEMKMRSKTKFHKSLSQVRASIFPKKKLLVDQVSTQFEKDVEQFISKHFQGDEVVGAPYFTLRDEIKTLQGMGKVLTLSHSLSSPVFNRTRLKLSECWEKIKVLEKEHKKEVHAKKQVSGENRTKFEAKIAELAAQELPLPELEKAIDEVSREMRQADLSRQDVVFLRDALAKLRAPHLAAEEERMKLERQAEEERIRAKKEKFNAVKDKLDSALANSTTLAYEELEQIFVSLKDEIKQLGITKAEQMQFDRSMRQLKDALAECRERNILNLSDDDRGKLEELRALLKEKKARRKEVNDQLENYRRTHGGSSLGFEKGLQLLELMEQEGKLLATIDLSIDELEQKIADLET